MTRVLSGAALLIAVAAAVWLLGPIPLLALAEIVVLIAFREYADLADRVGVQVPRAPAGAATLIVCAAVGVPGVPVEVAMMGAMLGLAAVVLASGRRGVDALHDVSAAAFAPLYLGLPLGALVAIRWRLGREAVLLLLLTVVLSDTAQFYIGRLFGRRLLAPAISPKKTVAGAVGGSIVGTAGMAGLGWWWLPEIDLRWRIALGLAVVAVGIAGDLFESLLKRSAGVKDASALIPGHGGLLDRIDALLFAAPVFYIFVRYRS